MKRAKKLITIGSALLAWSLRAAAARAEAPAPPAANATASPAANAPAAAEAPQISPPHLPRALIAAGFTVGEGGTGDWVAGFAGGVAVRGPRWLAVSLRFNAVMWSPASLGEAGYAVTRFDLGLAPHLILASEGQSDRVSTGFELYLFTPVGLSIPDVTTPQRRAFFEKMDGHTGWYAGLGLGVVLFAGRSLGLNLELSYAGHVTTFVSTATPSDGSPQLVTRYHDVSHEVVLTFQASLLVPG